ncbi:LysR family transcriptional regulator [Streptomyces sp. JJ66]|uniref:LysR family transcriptional regulator n=1 Tax=Streptomyces sp. JJ66 TaxID=2803843 RepID=UPI001C5A3EF8|nr:LysR family transcriptional regulator [Streptomyces sp. JJ66]MBW1603039.1 LysR family transcriptional regulator [Streptomyces sp. JJ66]
MELEVRHLRALCAIADAGSVRAAARQLGMTQPSLTTQLRRIEHALGGRLFVRERSGSRPTTLGRTVLSRARPIVAEMAALVTEAQETVRRDGEARLRIGSTGSTGTRTVVGWLRRLQTRYPEVDTSLHVEPSANALLQLVDAGQLDVVFVHEVAGCPLRVPPGLEQRVLTDREPQFVALSADHPAASGDGPLKLAHLAGDRWMVDPAADGEWDGLRRVFASAGLNPKVTLGDYMTGWELLAAGEVVIPCQPSTRERPGVLIRQLAGDPLSVRLFLASRPGPVPGTDLDIDIDEIFTDLRAEYVRVARESPAYSAWLTEHGSPLVA